MFEKILIAAVLAVPLLLLTWLIGIYDAGRVSLDPNKKERLWNRMKYAVNRLRMKGARGVMPRLEVFLMLILFLTFLSVYSYSYFPKRFYADRLELLQTAFSEKGMVLIPDLIGRTLDRISGG